MTKRGPLRFIILAARIVRQLVSTLLAATGLDVNQCAACGCCYVDEPVQAKFDLEIWEVLAAACENKQGALTNQTIWALAEVNFDQVHCSNELDVVTVARPAPGAIRKSFPFGKCGT